MYILSNHVQIIAPNNQVACEGTQVSMIDLKNGAQITRRPIQAEAALMNPMQNILALRSGTTVQIFNLDAKAKMKSHNMPEPVVYWKWTSPANLAMVTATSVWHWPLDGQAPPAKMFDRHASIGPNNQIINYRVSPDGKWCLLGGISPGANGAVDGNMQLFNLDKKLAQPLQGHAGAFATLKLPGREPAQVIVFHEKKPTGEPAKLYVREIGRDPALGLPSEFSPTKFPSLLRQLPISQPVWLSIKRVKSHTCLRRWDMCTCSISTRGRRSTEQK